MDTASLLWSDAETAIQRFRQSDGKIDERDALVGELETLAQEATDWKLPAMATELSDLARLWSE